MLNKKRNAESSEKKISLFIYSYLVNQKRNDGKRLLSFEYGVSYENLFASKNPKEKKSVQRLYADIISIS